MSEGKGQLPSLDVYFSFEVFKGYGILGTYKKSYNLVAAIKNIIQS